MPDQLATEQQAPQATPTPAADNAPVTQAAPAEPAAPQTLAQKEAAFKAELAARVAAAKAPPANDQAAPANDQGKPQETTGDAPKAEETPEEALAKYVRETRRLQEEKKALAAEKAAAKARQEEAQKRWEKYASAEELLGKGDRLGAARLLLGEKTVNEELFYDLVDALKEPQQLTPEQIAEKHTLAVLARERETAEAERKAQQEAVISEAERNYTEALAGAYRANKDKFPILRLQPVQVAEALEHVKNTYRATGAAPEPGEVLAHFEAAKRAELEPLIKAYHTVNPGFFSSLLGAATPAPPVRTITSAIARDTRGAVGEPAPAMSYYEREEARRKAVAEAVRAARSR